MTQRRMSSVRYCINPRSQPLLSTEHIIRWSFSSGSAFALLSTEQVLLAAHQSTEQKRSASCSSLEMVPAPSRERLLCFRQGESLIMSEPAVLLSTGQDRNISASAQTTFRLNIFRVFSYHLVSVPFSKSGKTFCCVADSSNSVPRRCARSLHPQGEVVITYSSMRNYSVEEKLQSPQQTLIVQ